MPAAIAKEPKSKPLVWFEHAAGPPNDTEIMFFTLLVLMSGKTVAQLVEWTSTVLVEEKRFLELGAAYTLPSEWKAAGNVVPAIFEPMHHACAGGGWATTALDQIGKAMQAWRGKGHFNGLRASHLREHLNHKSGVKALGPPKKPKDGPPRWKTGSALIRVAALIKRNRVMLRSLLKIDKPLEEVMTMEVELAEQTQLNAALAAQLQEKERAMKTLQDAWRKAAGRLKQANKKATKARHEEKAKASDIIKETKKECTRQVEEHTATVRGEVEAEYTEALKAAYTTARQHVRKSALADSRLKRLLDAEEDRDIARNRLDELFEEREAAEPEAMDAAGALTKIQAMPTWRPQRQSGRGGGRTFDVPYRRAIYSQFANGTPKSAVGQNIVAIVKATAPWLDPVPPSLSMLSNGRFEQRTIEEACAAREVADAYRIRVLGSDETTKFGNAGITSNVVIEPTRGAELKVVVLRGAYCSAGGTADAIANAIEIKCFVRGRDFIRRWEAMCRRLYPDHVWTGPAASGRRHSRPG